MVFSFAFGAAIFHRELDELDKYIDAAIVLTMYIKLCIFVLCIFVYIVYIIV